MSEVYTGARPGRPGLAAVLSAAILVFALGVAWVQVKSSRLLGPPTRIKGSHLVVQPPKGWIQRRDQPNTFILPIEQNSEHPELALEKRIRFDSGRFQFFVAPEQVPGFSNLSSSPTPAPIGRFNGVQATRKLNLRLPRLFGEVDYLRETIVRVAVTPRGDFIRVEYDPVAEPTPGDFDLMDQVCDTVRLDVPELGMSAKDAMQGAGVEFPTEPNWQFTGPDVPHVRGLYVGASDKGRPVWSLGIFRTWLAGDRKPADLLVDFVTDLAVVTAKDIKVQQSARADGAAIATVEYPRARGGTTLASACVVSFAPDQAVLIIACASPDDYAKADEACAKLAQSIGVTDSWPPIAGAITAGTQLAKSIAEKGASDWWADKPVENYYLIRPLNGTDNFEVVGVHREPLAAGSHDGYRGVRRRSHSGQIYSDSWTLANDALAYVSHIEDVPSRTITDVREIRKPGSSEIERTVSVQRRQGVRRAPVVYSIPISPNFVCPPAEEVARGFASDQKDNRFLMIDASSRYGRATHSRLLVPLNDGAESVPRVLQIADYLPRGLIFGYDDDREMAFQLGPGLELQRSTAEEVRKHFSGF